MKKFIAFFLFIILVYGLVYKLNNKQAMSPTVYSKETITKEQLKEYGEGMFVSQMIKYYNMTQKIASNCVNKSLETEDFVKTLSLALPFKYVNVNGNTLSIKTEKEKYIQYEFHMDGKCEKDNACYVIRLDDGKYGNKFNLKVIDGKLATTYNYTMQEHEELIKAFIAKNKKQ